MKYLFALLLASPAYAATESPPIQDLLTTDLLGYTCVKEEDLDAAFLNAGKGGTVPQTCISAPPPKDCEVLTDLLGREAGINECATYAYRWLTWADPDHLTGWGWDCGDCTVDSPKTPAIPLPMPGLLLLTGLACLWRRL